MRRITMDGVHAMSGKFTGLLARVQAIVPSVTLNHCYIHRESLAARKIDDNGARWSCETGQFYKARPLNSRTFNNLCQEMDSDYKLLFLHSEVRWLSRGKVLTVYLSCVTKDEYFSLVRHFNWTSVFQWFLWLAMVTYLADVFTYWMSLIWAYEE